MNYDIMIKGEKNIKSINLILSDYYKTWLANICMVETIFISITYTPISVHNWLSEAMAAFLNLPSLLSEFGKSDLFLLRRKKIINSVTTVTTAISRIRRQQTLLFLLQFNKNYNYKEGKIWILAETQKLLAMSWII